MKLSSRAVIAVLNVGAWRVVKRHAAETAVENARHGLTNEARVDVKICAHHALESIAELHFPNAVHIIDLYHAFQHVHELATLLVP
jgi:hypothetical protein